MKIVIYKLWSYISPNKRIKFIFLLVLTIVTSFAEFVSLGVVMPFVGLILQPEKIMDYSVVKILARLKGVDNSGELLVPIAILFITSAVIAGVLRLLLLYGSLKLGNSTGEEIAISIYARTLYQPYLTHVNRNSSEIISAISQKVSIVTSILVSLVTLITTLIVFSFILASLILINAKVAFASIILFGSAYAIIAFITKNRLWKNSGVIARNQNKVIMLLQEGLGSIRDIILNSVQKTYIVEYKRSLKALNLAVVENTFFNQFPRFVMEAMGMVLIGIYVLVISSDHQEAVTTFPILAVLALAAQRMLPLLQQIYGNWNVINGNIHILDDVINLLSQRVFEQKNNNKKNFKFNKEVEFRSVSYSYEKEKKYVLQNIDITIKKGERVGILGKTGEGKSTFVDLFSGLLVPIHGQIFVDGYELNKENIEKWQNNIAYVPQTIFLKDGNFIENIAFGVSKESVDFNRLSSVVEISQLTDFINSRKLKYYEVIGERGIKLSGGQRQRIGIARALYNNLNILILDEATSSLDVETETMIITEIEKMGREITIIMIAHRLSTLNGCGKILEFKNGKIFQHDKK